MTIISLSGKKQSGKTTVARMIKEIINEKFPSFPVHIISWADALKEEVSKGCGVSLEYIEEHKSNFRLILQGWGTDFRRKLCNDRYWIDKLLTKVVKLPDHAVVIIPDTRFENEYQELKYVGAFLCKINRVDYIIDNHQSENDLADVNDWDLFINNDGSLKELKEFLALALKDLNLC